MQTWYLKCHVFSPPLFLKSNAFCICINSDIFYDALGSFANLDVPYSLKISHYLEKGQ